MPYSPDQVEQYLSYIQKNYGDRYTPEQFVQYANIVREKALAPVGENRQPWVKPEPGLEDVSVPVPKLGDITQDDALKVAAIQGGGLLGANALPATTAGAGLMSKTWQMAKNAHPLLKYLALEELGRKAYHGAKGFLK